MNEGVQQKHEILTVLEQHHAQIRACGVKRLGLFGSFVRQEQRETSDVDILVEFEPEQKTFDHFMQLIFLLETLLQRRVELVTLESLSPYMQPYILDEVEYVDLAAGIPSAHA